MSVVVVATITPKPEHRDELIAAYTETIPLVHAEEGCELYALHEAPGKLMMIEKWASREALDKHSRGEALAGMRPKVADKVAGPTEVIVLDAVPAGEPDKGQL